jgi:hypothetical protein
MPNPQPTITLRALGQETFPNEQWALFAKVS